MKKLIAFGFSFVLAAVGAVCLSQTDAQNLLLHSGSGFNAPSSGCAFPTLSGSYGRWRADTGVTTSGGNVTAVTDQGGGGFTITNVGTVPFNATGYNSKPTFAFVAANAAGLTSASFNILGTGTTGSAYFVGQMASGTDPNGGGVSFVGTIAGTDFSDIGSSAWILREGANDRITTYTSGSQRGFDNISLATNYRLGAIFDGTNVTRYINNVAGTPAADTHAWANSATILSVGSRIIGGLLTGGAWEGPISEIVVGNAAYNGTERNALDAYFTCQWGV
jgi:hypothetical protein